MGDEMIKRVSDWLTQAIDAEAGGDLVEARRLWRLIAPLWSQYRSIEKDGLKVEYDRNPTEKIRDLSLAIGEANGAAKVRRVNLTYREPAPLSTR